MERVRLNSIAFELRNPLGIRSDSHRPFAWWLGVANVLAWFALAECPSIARAQPPLQISDALVTISQQVRVPTLSEGAITRLLVAEGDVVMVGQLLAQIDDREPRLALARAKSELETAIKAAESELEIRLATKKHELAKSDLTRIEKARSMLTGSVADEEFENRRLQVERTGLEIDKSKEDRQNAIAQAELHANDFRSAELALERTKVTAPLSGVIVSVERREGEWCKTGETILEILGTSKLRAEAMIDASEIRQSLVGRRVALFPDMNDGSDRKFLGVLRFENPEINPVDNRVSVWAEIDNSDGRLRPGMRGRMYIEMSGRVDPPTPALPSPPTTSRLQSTPPR